MARTRRYRDRQGVVYGHVRTVDGGNESTALVGRIVGVLIIVGALGALAVGALAFVGNGSGGPVVTSPAATLAAFSAPPTIAPTPDLNLPPSATPAASLVPTAAPTAAPTAVATPFALVVRVGPGFVTFGTQSDGSLRITDPRTSFSSGARVFWSAEMTEPVDSADLRRVIFAFDPETGVERLLGGSDVTPDVQGASIFLSSIRTGRLDGPGIYIVRYLRGLQVMSEGYFEVVD